MMRTETSRSRHPWWLAEEEPCEFCGHSHPATLEVRCHLCDRRGCVECIVFIGNGLVAWCCDCRKGR
jgi:hypothetical protein